MIIKAVSGCYQIVYGYHSSAGYYQSSDRCLSKQCPVIIRTVSGCYQTVHSYCHSSVRLLLKQCSTTITRVSEYIIKALPGHFQTSVHLLSNQCSAIIKAVWLLWKPYTAASTKVAGHCECGLQRRRYFLNFIFWCPDTVYKTCACILFWDLAVFLNMSIFYSVAVLILCCVWNYCSNIRLSFIIR